MFNCLLKFFFEPRTNALGLKTLICQIMIFKMKVLCIWRSLSSLARA